MNKLPSVKTKSGQTSVPAAVGGGRHFTDYTPQTKPTKPGNPSKGGGLGRGTEIDLETGDDLTVAKAARKNHGLSK